MHNGESDGSARAKEGDDGVVNGNMLRHPLGKLLTTMHLRSENPKRRSEIGQICG